MPLTRPTVLVSGASIAGPALAYWLHRHGFEVTLVEKSDAIRGGGYPIDVRGTAVEVVRRMGVEADLRRAHIHTRAITFLHADGRPITTVQPAAMIGSLEGRDLEVSRGDLTQILYAATRDDVGYRFGDSISTLEDHREGVDVRFVSGAQQTFDFVVGADGLHSHTRRLVFGPERGFHHYMGYCFAGFTMPNDLGLSHEGVMWNAPGRTAALYAVGDGPTVHGFLNFARREPPFEAFRHPDAQRDLVASVFEGDRWRLPRMLDAMWGADDLFFDVVSQIRMPRWSAGRVALVGDAAYAPSFLTGQGSSLALVGAYLLAGSMAAHRDPSVALSTYEQLARPFVERNQALVGDGQATLFPTTAQALDERNRRLEEMACLPADREEPAYTCLELPDFG